MLVDPVLWRGLIPAGKDEIVNAAITLTLTNLEDDIRVPDAEWKLDDSI